MDDTMRMAASLAGEAGRISQLVTSQIVEKTKEVGLPGHFYDNADEKMSEIIPGLESKYEREKVDALKRLIALLSKGKDVSEYFPHVIKNIVSHSFETRQLVYIYLLRHAEDNPDLALLSINTFQKDMADKNPLIRAMALRVMCSIKVPLIVPLIVNAIQRKISDLSPYVRKAVANCIEKCYRLDNTQKDLLVEVIKKLFNDKSTAVLGSAAATFNAVCPDRFDIIHIHYRKLCRLLIDCDEWAQIEIIKLLLRYVRGNFSDPHFDSCHPPSPTHNDSFYSDTYGNAVSKSAAKDTGGSAYVGLDPDHLLFIRTCRNLLISRNPSVVLHAISVFYYVAPIRDLRKSIPSLIRLLRYTEENLYSVMLTAVSISRRVPFAFAPYARQFAVYDGESVAIRSMKLQILETIADDSNVDFVLSEFKAYVRSPDEKFVVETIGVWGRLARRLTSVLEPTLITLVRLIENDNASIVGESVIVLRRLLQLPTNASSNAAQQHDRVIRHLFENYETILVPMARASILWLIGHHIKVLSKTAPDALRIALKTFQSEPVVVKLQILNLSAIACVYHELEAFGGGKDEDSARVRRFLRLCFEYALSLAKYDVQYDVRDRGRFLNGLIYKNLYPATEEQALIDVNTLKCLNQLLVGSMGISESTDPFDSLKSYRVVTLSHACRTNIAGYEAVHEWTANPSDPSLRVVQETNETWNTDCVIASEVKDVTTGHKKVKKRVVALDDFLATPPDVVIKPNAVGSRSDTLHPAAIKHSSNHESESSDDSESSDSESDTDSEDSD